MSRPIRADAERSVRAILEAAERVLAQDPSASLEQIAEAAGLTRVTVHRRFANRQALLDALAVSAKQQLADAIEDARPDSSPALIALHRVTESALRVKDAWRFTLGSPFADTSAAAAIWDDINDRTLQLLARAQREGLIARDCDLEWCRSVYYALLGVALNAPSEDPHADEAGSLVVETLLHGVGPRGPASSN